MDLIRPIASRLRAILLRARGVRIDGHCWLQAIEVPRGHHGIRLARGVALDRGVTLLITGNGEIRIGEQTYINRQTMIDASQQIIIGAKCMVGPFCYITDHDHDPRDPSGGGLISRPTHLGDGCWLGAHVTILKGVTIGEGAVVGAGSVVTRDVPARSVVAGNPARLLRQLGA